MIFDLYRTGKIAIREKKIVLIDSSSTNYLLFDNVITILQKNRALSPTRLLYKLGLKGNSSKKELVKILLKNGDIVQVRKRFLGIPYNRYFHKNSELRLSIIRRMRDILLRNERPSDDEMLLLILIKISRLYRALSDRRDERVHIRKQLKIILASKANYKNYDDIKLLQQSIQRVITASNA